MMSQITGPRSTWALSLLLIVLATGCSIEQRTDRETDGPPPSTRKQIIDVPGVARLPVFSSAVRSGDLIFLSGSIGAVPGVSPPTLVEGGVVPQTRQTMENIRQVLAAAGATMADIVKCSVFIADMADYGQVNEVYLEFFPSDPPARSALGANGLALGAAVEIECIAAVPEG